MDEDNPVFVPDNDGKGQPDEDPDQVPQHPQRTITHKTEDKSDPPVVDAYSSSSSQVRFSDRQEDIPMQRVEPKTHHGSTALTTQKKLGPLGRKRLRNGGHSRHQGRASVPPLDSLDSKISVRRSMSRTGGQMQLPAGYRADVPSSKKNNLLKSLFNIRPSTLSWKLPVTVHNADILDDNGLAPLHVAAEANDASTIYDLIRRGADVNVQSPLGKTTPLHIAARYNCPEAAEALLKRGADVTDAIINGQTALHICCRRGFLKVAKVLIDSGSADVNSRDVDKSTPLHQATTKGDVELCQFLVERGADIRAYDVNQVSPLMQAAHGGFKQCVQYLMSLANQVEVPLKEYLSDMDNEGNTALHLAVGNRHIAVARSLIERGAPVNCKKTTNGFAPLHQAAIIGEEPLAQMLIDKGAKTEIHDNEQMTPLHRAALYNRVDTILLLIRQGLYLDSKDEDNFTPLLCAAWQGQADAGRSLLRYGSVIEAVDKEMKSSLHWAVEMQHLEFAKMLFEHGHGGEEILDWKDRREQTALHYAAEVGNVKVLNLLIENGADLVLKDSEEKTPLHIASQSGHLECVEALLQACPIPLNDDDIDDMTPLLLASEEGHHQVVKFLIKMGADIASRNDDRRSSVALATRNNHMQTLYVLIDNNADVNAIDKDHNTPLHLCAQAGHVAPIQLLLNSGADLRLKNIYGRYPLDVAIEHKHEEVAKAILSSKNWEVAMNNCDETGFTPMRRLIAVLPGAALQVLNQCVRRSHDDMNHPELKVTYDYRYIDPGPDDITYDKNKERYFALQTMVHFKREKLLAHSLSQTSLARKWKKFARYFSYADFVFYLAFVILISVYLRQNLPVYNNTDRDDEGCPIVQIANLTNETYPSWAREAHVWFYNKTPEATVYHINIWDPKIIAFQLFIIIYVGNSIIYDVIKMMTQRFAYFRKVSNYANWAMFIPTYFFVFPPFAAPCDYNWVCGTIAIFCTWMNFIFVLNRFDFFGLYVTMFFTTLISLIKAMAVYMFFIIGFALAFFICFQQKNLSFRNEWSSIITTFVMTLGEINKSDLLDTGESLAPFEEVANVLVVIFLFLMPMVLINLTIGISVGDIDKILESSYVKRLSLQVSIILNTEEKFPRWFQRKMWQPQAEYWPNRKKNAWWHRIARRLQGASGTKFLRKSQEEAKKDVTIHDVMAEVNRHQSTLCAITTIIHQQGDLLRRIAEKHDIFAELDDPFAVGTTPANKVQYDLS